MIYRNHSKQQQQQQQAVLEGSDALRLRQPLQSFVSPRIVSYFTFYTILSINTDQRILNVHFHDTHE